MLFLFVVLGGYVNVKHMGSVIFIRSVLYYNQPGDIRLFCFGNLNFSQMFFFQVLMSQQN